MISAFMASAPLVFQMLAQAETEAAPSPWPGFSMMAIVIVVFYFIVIAPQRKEAKEREAMRSAVKKGDEVVTIGGLFGTVTAADKNTVTLRVQLAPKVDLTFERSAISRVTKKSETPEKKADTAEKKADAAEKSA
jgi:preprotein translocase subunit YajC